MKTVIVSAFAALLVVIGASPVVAQQPTDAEINEYIELVRMDVRQGRADLIGQHMQLSASQAARFWPIYEAYEMAFTSLGDDRIQNIRDLHDHDRRDGERVGHTCARHRDPGTPTPPGLLHEG